MTTISRKTLPVILSTDVSQKNQCDFRRQSLIKIFLNKITFGSAFKPQLKLSNVIAIRNFKLRKLIVYPKASSVKYNDTLEGVRQFVKELTALSIDCIQKKYVDPAVARFDADSEKIPGILKIIAEEFISYGEQSSKTVFEIFEAFNFTDSAIEKLQNTMAWALKDLPLDDPEQKLTFRNKFKEELLQKIDDEPTIVLKKEISTGYAETIIDWIINGDHKVLPPEFKKTTHNIIFQKALLILSELKIDHYKTRVNKILQNDLSKIIRNSIKENALKIADILSSRVADVFNKLSTDDAQFAVIFDKIIEILSTHVKNLSFCHEQADIAEKKHLKLEKRAKFILANNKKTPDEIAVYKEALRLKLRKESKDIESYLKAVQYLEDLSAFDGVAGLKKHVLLKTFLADTGNLAPSITSDKLISEISDHLFNILLPTTNEKEGFEILLSQINMPPAYHELLKEAKDTVKMISSEKDYDKIVGYLRQFRKGGKKIGLLILEVLKMGMSEAIQMGLKHLSKPEELNILFSESILPAAHDAMLEVYVDDLICDNVDQLIPHFSEKEKFIATLSKIARKKTKHTKTKSLFKKTVDKRFNELHDLVKTLQVDVKNSLLLKEVIQQYYAHNYNKYSADDFLRTFSSVIEKLMLENEPIDIVLKALQKLAMNSKNEYSYLNPEIDTTFNNAIMPRLEQIFRQIQSLKLNKTPLIKNEILQFLNKNSITSENNKHFSDLVSPFLKTDQFGSLLPTLFNFKSIRNVVSRLLTQSMSTIRNHSYRPILNSTLQTLEKNCLHENVIEGWITESPSLESLDEEIDDIQRKIPLIENRIKEETKDIVIIQLASKLSKLKNSLEEKNKLRKVIVERKQTHLELLEKTSIQLPKQIKKISKISYDLLVYKISRKSILGKIFIKRIIGKNHKNIKSSIFSIFNNVFSHQSFNEHLLSNLFLTKVQALDWSANKIDRGVPYLLDENNFSSKNNEIQITRQSIKTDFKETPFKKRIPKTSIWKRVYRLVVRIFSVFAKLFKSEKRLSQEEVQKMTSLNKLLHKKKLLDVHDSTKVAIVDSSQEPLVDPLVSLDKQQALSQAVEDFKDPLNKSLINIQNFASDFMKKLGDELFTQKIEPITRFISISVDKLPSYIEVALDWISRITEPTANSILKIILQTGFKFDLTETQQGFLAILFSEIKDAEGNTKDLKNLRDEFDKLNLKIQLNPTNYKHYRNVIFQWLTQDYTSKKEIKSLNTVIEDNKSAVDNFLFNDEIVSHFYIAAVRWLVHNKIQNSVSGLQNFLENDLAILIKTLLDKNLQHMTETLFYRVAELINQIDNDEYKAFFDDCFKDIHAQLKNIHAAKKNKKVKHKFTSKDDIETVTVELSSNCEKYDITLLSKPLFLIPSQTENIDLESYKNKALTEIFNDIVKRLMDLILPIHQIPVDGQIIKVDTITNLLESILIDTSIKNKFEEVLQFIKSVVPEKFSNKMDAVVAKGKQQLLTFLTNIIRKRLNKMIAASLKENFQLLIDQDKRKEIITQSFPSIEYHMVLNFASLFITPQNLNKYYKILIETSHTEDELKRLQDSLKAELKRNFYHSWETLKIDEQFADKYFHAILKNINRYFLNAYFYSENHKDILNSIHENLILLYNNENDEEAFKTIFEIIFCNIKEDKKLNFFWNDHLYLDLIRNNFKHYLKEAIKPLLYELHLACKNELLTIDLVNKILKDHILGINDQKKDYSNFISEMIQPVNFGAIRDGVVKFFMKTDYLLNIITDGLIPAMHPVRGSFTNVLDLLTSQLRVKWINHPTAIKDLFKPKTLKSLKSVQCLLNNSKSEILILKSSLDTLSDQYPQKVEHYDRQLKQIDEKSEINEVAIKNIEEQQQSPDRYELLEIKFEKGFTMLALLLYDFCANKATTSSAVIGLNPQFIRDDILIPFYNDFFMDENSNLALLINMIDKVIRVLESKNRALR